MLDPYARPDSMHYNPNSVELDFSIGTTFLLLSKSPAPCDYAASANPEGAKLSFAFSSFDQLRSHPMVLLASILVSRS